MMDSDDEWDGDEDGEAVIKPRVLPEGSLYVACTDILRFLIANTNEVDADVCKEQARF